MLDLFFMLIQKVKLLHITCSIFFIIFTVIPPFFICIQTQKRSPRAQLKAKGKPKGKPKGKKKLGGGWGCKSQYIQLYQPVMLAGELHIELSFFPLLSAAADPDMQSQLTDYLREIRL